MKETIIGETVFMMQETCFELKPSKPPYGTLEVEVIHHQESEIAFLNRHGKGDSAPPPRIRSTTRQS